MLTLAVSVAAASACDSDGDSPEPVVEWSTGTTEALTIPGLPPGLPIPAAAPESVERTSSGGVVASWSLRGVDAGASASDLAARAREAPDVTVLAAELAATGGIIAFEAERAGHYLVTADPAGDGARVELWLDPAPTAAPTMPSSVALPEGYPEDVLPVFPDAAVVEQARDQLAAGRERFRLSLIPPRSPLEVLGFYRDHLAAGGWSVTESDSSIEATRGSDVVRIGYADDGTTLRVTLEWTPPE